MKLRVTLKLLLVLALGVANLPSGSFAHLARRNRRVDRENVETFSFKERDRDHDTETKFIDLTHAFNNETAVWPGRKITFYTEFESRNENGVWMASNGFCTSEHTSTHIDAPYHFNENGRRLHEIPFEDLIDVPGAMIDIYEKVHHFEDGKLTVIDNYALTREDVIEWEEKNGRIPQGAVVLLRTGWDSRWGDPRLFRGEKPQEVPSSPPADPTEEDLVSEGNEIDTGGDLSHGQSSVSNLFYNPSEAGISSELSFPAYDVSAAKYLAEERAVRGVGVDVISIDPGNKNVMSPAHVKFASRNIYMLEMVANLHQLPPKGFRLWMVPFKIDRGTGAPTRVIARLNGD